MRDLGGGVGAIESSTTIVMPARPITWVRLCAALHLLAVLPLALAFYIEDLDQVGVIVFWCMASVPVLVIGCFVGLAAASRSRAVTNTRPHYLRWVLRSVGALLFAHWVPFLAWTPAALVWLVFAAGARTDDLQASGFVGLSAWLVCGATGAMLVKLRMARDTPRPRVRRVGAKAPWAEWVVAGCYALPAAAFLGGWVAQGQEGAGLAWIAIPLAGGLTVLWGAPQAWCGAAADMVAARLGAGRGDWRWSFFGRLAGLILLVALPLFATTLLPMWHGGEGQRFGLQVATLVVTTLATWTFVRWLQVSTGHPAAAGYSARSS